VPRESAGRPAAGRLALDLLVAGWAALWVAVGAGVALEVRGLAGLSETVGSVGRSVEETGGVLRSLDGLPLVGGGLGPTVDAVERAGRDAVVSARESRGTAERVALLLGASIAVIPVAPVLLLYLPARLAFARDRRAVRRALTREGGAALDEVLALRAVSALPYHRLQAVTATPGQDLADGRHRHLADAELARLGLRRPPPSGAGRRSRAGSAGPSAP
jgi:hypothetical protein